jgi:hypothetical protein
MHSKWIQRLTLGLAAVALFAAAGGPTYAAKKVKTISGTKIKKNTIAADRLTSSARASLKGNVGPQGQKGDAGAPGSAAAYASIDGYGPTIQSPYNKNILSVTKSGAGRYCVYVDWAAAGRSPANQATPVIATPRSITQNAAADQYNATCPGNGISVSLNTTATATAADGWVHVLIP